jgi:hypothetical protein
MTWTVPRRVPALAERLELPGAALTPMQQTQLGAILG